MNDINSYKLSDFNDVDIKKAKEYFKSAYLGLIRSTIDKKIDNVIEEISKRSFKRGIKL